MTARHPAIAHWTEIEDPVPGGYSRHDEPMSMGGNKTIKGIGISPSS